MKRRFGLVGRTGVLAAIAVFAFSGCGDGGPANPVSPSVTSSPAAPPAAPQPLPGGIGYTVSGVVSELVGGVAVPLEGVHVDDSQRHVFVTSAADGSYTIRDVETHQGSAYFYFFKEGYGSLTRTFPLTSQDTRLDVQFVR